MNVALATKTTTPWINRFGRLVNALIAAGHDTERHRHAVAMVQQAKWDGRTIYFIGNGGSAAIASHMAADFLKNGNVAAQCFNDGALTTCLANDLGYENVFARPLLLHGKKGDVLVAISSSGQSKSILSAVEVAKTKGMGVIVLSGFSPDNPLRAMGDVSFYVPYDNYGTVEICHHAIIHAVLDEMMHAAA